jgi:hypothetical protein
LAKPIAVLAAIATGLACGVHLTDDKKLSWTIAGL